MTNDPNEVRQLIHSCQGLVRSIAWKFHQQLPPSMDMDDLIGYGQVGLAEAARDFDASRGVQFTTYAYYRVRGAILDGLSRMSWFNKADFSRGKYESAANEVLKTSETTSETNEDAVWFSRTAGSLGTAFILTHLGATELEIPDRTSEEVSTDLERTDLRNEIQQVLTELPEAERNMIHGIYFEGLSIKEAGERMQIGKAWASRLHARALELLSMKMLRHSENPTQTGHPV